MYSPPLRPATSGPAPISAESAAIAVSVIVPTYCEEANLLVLVPRVAQALANAGLTGEILIVDDNSPDKTVDVCAELSREYPVRLIVRYKDRGLSSAVLEGLRQAKGAILLVMDADLSHPPEKVPDLVAALKDPSVDFVIGSRYVPGAATDERWGLFRWLNSKVATLLARPLTSSRDPMAGFFALRQSTFASADFLDPIGYKIGLELLVKCRCRNVREIPITFNDRLHGKSKLNFKEQLNYLRHLKRLFDYKYANLFRASQFAAVGVTGMAVDLFVFWFLGKWMLLGVARAVSIIVAMTWNFLLNRRLTFGATRHGLPWWQQYLRFCTGCSVGAVVNWSVSIALVAWNSWFAEHRNVAACVGIVTGFVFNYELCRRFVFLKGADAKPAVENRDAAAANGIPP